MPVKKKQEKPILGIEWESTPTPFAFCGSLKWDIQKMAHTKTKVDKMMLCVKEYESEINQIMTGKSTSDYNRNNTYNKATKTILELGLVNFNYEKAANDPQAGPALLGILAGELKDFCLSGGALGRRHLQTRANSQITI